jgi:quinol monooxygenase YgiN
VTEPQPGTVVVAHWRTTTAALEAVHAHIERLRVLSLSEVGCLGYEAFQSVDDPTHLVLVEHYRDDAALDEHIGSAHYRDLVVGQVRPLLIDRQVEVLHPRTQS